MQPRRSPVRKRGILTDTIDLILAVTVTAAGLSENALGIRLLDQAKEKYPTVSKSRVDTGYETLTASSEAAIHIASVDNLAGRIADETALSRRGAY